MSVYTVRRLIIIAALLLGFAPSIARAQYAVSPANVAFTEQFCAGPLNCAQIVLFFFDTGAVGQLFELGHVTNGGAIAGDETLDGPALNLDQTVANDGGIGAYLVQMMPDVNNTLARLYSAPNYIPVQNTTPFTPSIGNIALFEYFSFGTQSGPAGVSPMVKFKPYVPGPNPTPLP